ncbi:molybdenum cofactor biosynthesis protein B [Chloroflexota bacterium]
MFNLAILTVSDKGSQGGREDVSGKTIRDMLSGESKIIYYEIVPDETDVIAAKLKEWADGGGVDVILTTGGTGFAPRDVTPEATLLVVDRLAPGFAEAMRIQGFAKTPFAILSRAAAGIRGNCLIINLPGSPKAVREGLEIILPTLSHTVGVLKKEITEHTAGKEGK